MIVTIEHKGQYLRADLSQPMPISIPLRSGAANPNCFWAPMPEFEPVRAGDFVGSTAEGGVVNFFNVRLNPHGNGTHTECLGHIAKEPYLLPECVKKTHFLARLVTVYPTLQPDGDRVIDAATLQDCMAPGEAEALIIRTMPNHEDKMERTYSGANPPYLHAEAVLWTLKCGIEHLLLDLPSVDREEDGGLLLAHRAFWQYPSEQPRTHCTITEMVFVPDDIKDGLYLLDLQITHLMLDASPSRPVLYALK
jgi:arylformamidase